MLESRDNDDDQKGLLLSIPFHLVVCADILFYEEATKMNEKGTREEGPRSIATNNNAESLPNGTASSMNIRQSSRRRKKQ